MNKAKKFLVGLLAFASVSAFALGLTGCEDEKPSAGTGTGNGTNTEQGGGLGGLGGGSSSDENDEQGGNTGNEETHTHVYLDLLNVNYIAQEATCTSGTIYYQSCACGARGAETFTYGDPIAHEYDQEVATDAYFSSAADCYNKAQYYYSCTCGAKGNWTFSYGDYAHTFDQQVLTPNNYWQDEDYYVANAGDCTHKTQYYYSCTCGEKGTETFECGDYVHTFDQEVATDAYFSSAADCYNKAQYYYSCKCGAKGNWTFSYGDYAHTFDQQVLTRDYWYDEEDYYLASAGDCTHKATYYYSCTCGEKGTETFEYGDYVHSWEEEYTVDGDEHWIDCENCDERKENGTHVAMDDGYCVCDTPISSTVGITYDFSSDGTYAEVIGYTGSSTRVIIADTYQNKPVKTIYDDAFDDKDITSVVIPDSVTTIGRSVFSGCNSLTSVTIGNSVTTIGDWAFGSCSRLTSVTIGDSVTTIGDWAFGSCRSLTIVAIPDSVTAIGDSAFSGCGLTSVAIPNSVTTIGRSAFYGCGNLISVTIPNSVTAIGDGAFADCPDELFTVYENVKYLGNDNNPYYALIETVADTYSNYIVHAQTKIIADNAFSFCTRLTSVTIGDSVTTIGGRAFYDCDSLTSVTIGDSVTTIGLGAFCDCDSLTSVVFIDTSTWYRTNNYEDWQNKVNGEQVDVSDAETAADLLYGGYWYKL